MEKCNQLTPLPFKGLTWLILTPDFTTDLLHPRPIKYWICKLDIPSPGRSVALDSTTLWQGKWRVLVRSGSDSTTYRRYHSSVRCRCLTAMLTARMSPTGSVLMTKWSVSESLAVYVVRDSPNRSASSSSSSRRRSNFCGAVRPRVPVNSVPRVDMGARQAGQKGQLLFPPAGMSQRSWYCQLSLLVNHLVLLKCTKIRRCQHPYLIFSGAMAHGQGSTPAPAMGVHNAAPNPLVSREGYPHPMHLSNSAPSVHQFERHCPHLFSSTTASGYLMMG